MIGNFGFNNKKSGGQFSFPIHSIDKSHLVETQLSGGFLTSYLSICDTSPRLSISFVLYLYQRITLFVPGTPPLQSPAYPAKVDKQSTVQPYCLRKGFFAV